MTFFSRSDSVWRTDSSCSCSRMKLAASIGHDGVGVLDEVAEVRVLLLADRRLQRHRLLGDLQDLPHLLGAGCPSTLPISSGSRLAAEVLQQLALHADQLVDRLHHVHGDADGPGLVGDGAGDGLADPPRGVRRELVALGVVELLHRADQAEVPLLDQVEEQHPAPHVALGDGDHQAQVRLDQLAAWRAARRARRGAGSRSSSALGLGPVALRDLARGRCPRPCRTLLGSSWWSRIAPRALDDQAELLLVELGRRRERVAAARWRTPRPRSAWRGPPPAPP